MNGLIEFTKEIERDLSIKQKSPKQKPSLSERIKKGNEKVRESDQNKDKPVKPKKINRL